MKKRILSLIVALTMIFGMIPSFAMEAAGLDEIGVDKEVIEGPEADLKRAAELLEVTIQNTNDKLNSPVTDEEWIKLLNNGPGYDYSIWISWESSDESLISINEIYDWWYNDLEEIRGYINLPEEGEKSVTLTATLHKGSYSLEKHFDYILTKDKPIQSEDEKYLSDAIEELKWFNLRINSDDDPNVISRMESELTKRGYEKIDVSVKSSDKEQYIDLNGNVSYRYDEKYLKSGLKPIEQVLLNFNFEKGEAKVDFSIRTVVGWNRDKVREVIKNKKILPMSDDLIGTNESLDKIKENFQVPTRIEYTMIDWESSDENVLKIEPSNYPLESSNMIITRGKEDKNVTLTAKVKFNHDDGVIIEKKYELKVLAIENAEDTEESMQKLLDENYTVDKLKNSTDSQVINPEDVKNDIQLLTPRNTGIEGYFNYKFEVESNSDLVDINTYRANVYRPLPNEEIAQVNLTVSMTHKEKDITVTKVIPIKITPLSQQEIDDEIELVRLAKENYFQGIKGENISKDKIISNLHSFREVNLVNNELVWTYHIDNDKNTGLFPDELEGWENQEQWRIFKSSHSDIIKHENLLVSKPEYTTDVKIESTLSSKEYGKYAKKYPEVEDFQKLYKQDVSVLVTVLGDKEGKLEDEEVDKIDVGVSILVFNEDGGYTVKHDPTIKTIEKEKHNGGITAFGALQATTDQYSVSGEMVDSIDEIKGPSTGGWMFTVNGVIPDVGAGKVNLKEGDKVIWFCTYDYKTDIAPTWQELTGEAPEEKTTLKIKEIKNPIKVGDELSLEAEVKKGNEVLENRKITWSSSNEEIVSIDENGKLEAHKVGQVDISASLVEDENVKDTIKIKIVKENKVQAKEQLDENLERIYKEISNPKFGNEWSILSLARGEFKVSEEYYDLYYDNIVAKIKENNGEFSYGTDYSRLIIALTAIGKDVTNVGGYNLLEGLTDFEYVTKQGINGSIYSLLALDSHEYEIPTKATYNQTTRNKLIKDILDKEVDGGGWSWGSSPDADIDMTAMAIQALSPYYNKQNTVKTAIDRSIDWLSKEQADHGGFESWGSNSAETISQVIVALTDLAINPHKDERFIKYGNSPIDSLLTFEIEDVKSMTMEQSTYALLAYDRYLNNKTGLYNMSDIEINKDPGEPEESFEEIYLKENENNPKIEIPEDDSQNKKNYRILVKAEDKDKTININIPEKSKSKLLLDLSLNTPLPEIQARKDKVSVNIPRSIELLSGKSSKVEILISKDAKDRELKNIIERNISRDYELDRVYEVIGMGGEERIEFSDYVSLTFEGQASRDVGYIENNEFHTISKYGNDQSGRDSKKEEYAYSNGNDLIVKTKHFTDFVAYTTKENKKNDNNGEDQSIGDSGSNDKEDTNRPESNKPYITLSIDKRTINKGYVLNRVDVGIRKGDTVWDVLKDQMDRRGIDYKASGNGYIQSIDGDGEFDYGPGSGWMFMVDGKYPEYGSNQLKLYGGERVEWRYTKNLGEDLGEDLSKWEEKEKKEEVKLGEPEIEEDLEEVKKENKSELVNTQVILTKEKEKEIKEVLNKKYKDTETISSWALNDVQRATELGFVEGFNNEFNPKAYVKRAEFVKMIISLLDLDLEKIENNNFTDINESDWFYAYVNAAYEAGIVMGSEGKFNPNDNMTREEMASIIARLLKLKHEKTDEKIKDIDKVSNWAKNDVESVVASGLLVGYENNFNPKDMATREMAATVLMRAYDYKNKE